MSDLCSKLRNIAKISTEKYAAKGATMENSYLNQAADLIEQLQARVVELERVICAMMVADETGYVDGEGYVEGFDKLTETGKRLLAERDALVSYNAIIKAIDSCKSKGKYALPLVDTCELYEYAERVKRGEL